VTEIRPFAADELVAAHTALELAFGSDPNALDRDLDLTLLRPEDTLGAWDGGAIVATAGFYDLPMTIPGGVLDVAGVTWVSVAPTHRRQGLVTQVMQRQLTDLHEAGRSVAALWASEGAIYQRFGYGAGSWHLTVEPAAGAAFTRPVDVSGLRIVTPSAKELQGAFDRRVGSVPGWWARSPEWWAYRLYDPEHRRGGSSSMRAVVDGDTGYALYRTKNEWGNAGPNGTVAVIEVVASDPASEARLWRFLLDQDLMRHVRGWAMPIDTPLMQLLAEPRAAQARVADALWVRLVDVPGALVRRTYAAEVDVVVELTDRHCPWNTGRWRLAAGPGGATCEATTDAADLSCDVRDLGAAYLGGTSLATRAAAGWVSEQTPGALAAATVAFSWPGRAPHAPMVF
jgi:predicted acetyltransferase